MAECREFIAVTLPAVTVMAPVAELVTEIPSPADAVTACRPTKTSPDAADSVCLITLTPAAALSATLKPSLFVVDPMAETSPATVTETKPPPLL